MGRPRFSGRDALIETYRDMLGHSLRKVIPAKEDGAFDYLIRELDKVGPQRAANSQ